MSSLNGASLAEAIMSAESSEIRGVTFTVPPDDRPIPPLYPHQEEALERLRARPSVSTILHLPTGSGKTRIALEFIAELLHREPTTTILWASYPTTLIRQAMVRTLQLSPRLPTGMQFVWAYSDRKRRNQPGLFANHHLIFALRGTLANMLADLRDRPRKSALRQYLATGARLVVIYDECHQLGARRLQRGWRVLDRHAPPNTKWPRILGLSATPLPRNPRRRVLLWKTLFPLAQGGGDPEYPWRMDVAYRVHNAALERLGVLCPVNVYQQRSGFFDIPTEVLDRATRRRPIEEPSKEGASSDELLSFAAQFNARVMSHPLVLRFLAGRVATRIEQLGKTLVFMPTIRAANALWKLLKAHPATTDRVFMVHTRLDALAEEEEDAPRHVYEELTRFSEQGDAPSVMINVGMLTTGFDDPKIRTIVLGRLTYSMNLYWQMIGRGSRGPRSGGTQDCMVIDPIRLTRLYPIAEGYRPTLTQSNEERVLDEADGVGRLDPTLTVVNRGDGAGPGPTEVEESWFDAVELDEDALTAYVFKAEEDDDEDDEPVVVFDDPVPLVPGRGADASPRERFSMLALALSADGFQRVGLAFGIPFVGEVSREDAVDEVWDAVEADERGGISTFFGAILSSELRRLVLALGLPTPSSKKAAYVASLIYDWILDDAQTPLAALCAPDGFVPKTRGPGQIYGVFDKRYKKRQVQVLLDRLGEARSAKNKRILIRRVFESVLWRGLR